MVQNIRPPHDLYFVPRHLESAVKPVRDGDSSVDTDPRISTPEPAPTIEKLEQAAARVKDVLRGTTSRLEIEIDSDSHKAVIKILNGESGEIIRQIPAQELLDLAKHLDEPKGLLIQERA
ncbi:MAG: flagellar protein FlaG [Nitrospirota bacterium]